MSNIVYKVVKHNLQSARCGDFQYKIGEFVYAPANTQLFCFRSLDGAEDFRRKGECPMDEDRERIFEAEAGELYEPKLIPALIYVMDDYWLRFKKGVDMSLAIEEPLGLDIPPFGTLFTEKIKLIREIK